MKQAMKVWMVALAVALVAGMARADVTTLDAADYLYWMVDSDYSATLGDDWKFEGARLIAVLKDDTKIPAESLVLNGGPSGTGPSTGWFYAQGDGDAPHCIKVFGPLKAAISSVSQPIQEFYVEFYRYNANGEFDLLGYSDPTSWADVQSALTSFRDDRDPHVATGIYSPNGYHANVPEPSSGLLLLVGAALLGLKRRPRA